LNISEFPQLTENIELLMTTDLCHPHGVME